MCAGESLGVLGGNKIEKGQEEDFKVVLNFQVVGIMEDKVEEMRKWKMNCCGDLYWKQPLEEEFELWFKKLRFTAILTVTKPHKWYQALLQEILKST